MQSLSDYLIPVSIPKKQYQPHQWGYCLRVHYQNLPDLTDVHLAIVGIAQTSLRSQEPIAADVVRLQLYELYNSETALVATDLGNIRACPSPTDTYYALAAVVKMLLRQGIVPIIIGNEHDGCIGQFWGHAAAHSNVNVAIFDRKIDALAATTNEATSNANYDNNKDIDDVLVEKLLQHPQMTDLTHLAHQRSFIDPHVLDRLEKRQFECYGLGEMRPDIHEIEPTVRNRHLVSFDMCAVRQADAPATNYAPPAGLHAEEALSIARYAGLSDHVCSIGLYGYMPLLDRNNQTARLMAQMIWYFAEGFYSRKNDFPEQDEKRYLRYIVHFKDNDHQIVFLKSKKSDRWWMSIPAPQQTKGYLLYPCSYNDYQTACRDEIPDRWLKALLRWGK